MNLPSLGIGRREAKLPIIQGGMAVLVSTHRLAAAVANQGGVGVIAASGIAPARLRQEIRKARELTSGVIGVNIMVAVGNFFDLLTVCLEEAVDLVILGAGLSREAINRCKEAGRPVYMIASSVKAAVLGVKFGADAVILEAPAAAGGHLGVTGKDWEEKEAATYLSIWELLPDVVSAFKERGLTAPLIAAGGILKGRDIGRALSLGAVGVQIGTRFAMSVESNAGPEMKARWVAAKSTKIVRSPVGLPGRVVADQGKDLPPAKSERECVRCLSTCGRDYCIIQALLNAVSDKPKGLFFAGSRVGEMVDIPTVAEIFRRLKIGYSLWARRHGAEATTEHPQADVAGGDARQPVARMEACWSPNG